MTIFIDPGKLQEAFRKALVPCPGCGAACERGWFCNDCGRCPKDCDCAPVRGAVREL